MKLFSTAAVMLSGMFSEFKVSAPEMLAVDISTSPVNSELPAMLRFELPMILPTSN